MVKKITDSKWFYILVSILMAFVLWIYVGKEANPLTTGTLRNVQVVYTGLDVLEERGLMISEGANQTVSLNIQARRDVFARLSQGDVTVTIDVSGITEPGEQSIAITTRIISYPRSIATTDAIDLRYTSPATVDFTVSRWTEKDIPVQAVFEGSVAEGYQRGEFSITPETITISGQEELVDQIQYAQVTVSQQELTETYSEQCSVSLIDQDGNPVVNSNVQAQPQTVLVTLPVEVLKEVPLTVNLIDGGGATAVDAKVTIEPADSIMVSGSQSDLEGLKEISLGDIDLSDVYSTNTFTKEIALSPELTNVSGITEVTVTVSIQGLTTRTMKVSNIELINAPEGYTPEAITKSCSVLIRGPEEEVNKITESQLRIVADLSTTDPSTGSRTVPVKVYLDGSSNVGVVGDYSISVSLS
ncbi:CdaR family protein [uncultured Flavonifractor sp.]|uniref:CdaR family protein n=1 Tax=uncultured Flavonifractor sp. TaxID=1193534 RepID=UPI002626A12C|nr:CdaR family protein [uncultured Flavonifractor sp.]